MRKKSEERKPEDFWREYEELTGEKVLAHGLGRYTSGWEEFESKNWKDIWGLLIISSGGFRFHHFPQQNWLSALVIRGNSEGSKEKIIFIPKEKIIKAEFHEESRWWAKIFSSNSPQLVIHYRDGNESEKKLYLEADLGSEELKEKLGALYC